MGVRSWESGVVTSSRKMEVRRRKSGDGSQEAEARRRKSGGGSQEAEVRRRKSGDGSQETEVRRRKSGDGSQAMEFRRWETGGGGCFDVGCGAPRGTHNLLNVRNPHHIFVAAPDTAIF